MLFVVIIISLICLYFFFSTSDSEKAEEINRRASLQAKSIIDQKEAEIQGKFKKTEYDLINKYNNKIAQKLNEMESFKHNIEIQYKKESLDSIEAHKKEINTYYNNLIADHMNQYNDAKLRLEDEKKVLEKEYQYYDKEIKKIFSQYEKYFELDNDNKPIVNTNGIPLIKDEYKDEVQGKYTSEINELLNIESDVDLYSISVDCFEYDDADNKYDILTPMEIMNLQRIICSKEDTNV